MIGLLSQCLKKDDVKSRKPFVSYESGNRFEPALRRRKKHKEEKVTRKIVSGIMLTLLLMTMLTLTFNIQPVKADGTIYVRPDGSVDPPTAPIQRNGDIYTFTDNIYNQSIAVQINNITLDGNGHLLQGPITGLERAYGIYLSSRKNVTITNIVISSGFIYYIHLESSSNCRIVNNSILGIGGWYGIRLVDSYHNLLTNNTVMNTYKAIELVGSRYNTLSNNEVMDNTHGIWLNAYYHPSTGNTLRNNVMTGNKHGFLVYSHFHFMSGYINDVDTSNTVDGKPIYYWINRYDESVPLDAGCVVIVNSSRMTVRNLRLRNTATGVCLAYTENSVIENVTATVNYMGIDLQLSRYNVITRNNLTDNDGPGIFLHRSNHNSLTDNFVQNTNTSGIWLEDCGGGNRGGSPGYNTLIGNTVLYSRTCKPQEWDGAGILVDDSTYCKVIDNNVTNNSFGIVIGASHAINNQISGNNIVMNDVGLMLGGCVYNAIYHNNFIDNKLQVDAAKGMWKPGHNTLDNGYPSGGNYLSNYDGADVKKGPNQDQPGSDGIGDTHYIIYDNNLDHYPLMYPFGSPTPPTCTLTIKATTNGVTDPALGTYTYSRSQNVPVKAIPHSGYALDRWELDGVNAGTASPVDVTMNADHTLHAFFTPGYTLTITATVGGTTNPAPGTYTRIEGTVVSVTAMPDAGYYFDYWELDGVNNSANPISLAMNKEHKLKAVFAPTLTVTATGEGSTDPAPGTYNCSLGTMVSVTALPDTGYYLDRWELDGVDIGIPNPVNVTMNMKHVLHALFKQLSSGHDVAIKGITSKTVVGQGHALLIQVTAINVGSYTENFNITAYASTTIIETQEVSLLSGQFETITFEWNTSGFSLGNYTIKAVAEAVDNETVMTDNVIYEIIHVSILGDINADGIVNILDVAIAARAFGSKLGDPSWNSNSDMNDDGQINILDIAIFAKEYGKKLPK